MCNKIILEKNIMNPCIIVVFIEFYPTRNHVLLLTSSNLITSIFPSQGVVISLISSIYVYVLR